MSSPRKFAEKIALIQQKQAEGDAAFKTIIYEVEVAKQKVDNGTGPKSNKLQVPPRKDDISNGINKSDTINYSNQSLQTDNNNRNDRLLVPPDNPSWRRTHSDSSLNHNFTGNGVTQNYLPINNENRNQQTSYYNTNNTKFDTFSSVNHHNSQISNSQYHLSYNYDLNNNNNNNPNFYYNNGGDNISYPHMTTSISQNILPPSNNPNVLMLPPNQNLRNGNSLPDLRVGNHCTNTNNNQQQQQVSYTPVPLILQNQNCYPTPENNDGNIYVFGPQQQVPSNVGPLKKSPSMRRRHSPIEVRQLSPRRGNSPTPDMATNQNIHLTEPISPQSQSSYSSQNSPHFLPSPGNDLSPFSPQQINETQQSYFTLSNHFDQISLATENNHYNQQQIPSPSSQHNHNQSLPTTSIATNDMQQLNIFPELLNNLSSTSYHHNRSTENPSRPMTKTNPNIPDIILTDADSSKIDLSKDLNYDFTNLFNTITDANDMPLNTDMLFFNPNDINVDDIIGDEAFNMER